MYELPCESQTQKGKPQTLAIGHSILYGCLDDKIAVILNQFCCAIEEKIVKNYSDQRRPVNKEACYYYCL